MIILDTDHMSALQRSGASTTHLVTRLDEANVEIVTSIITVEEMIRGWMAQINGARLASAQVPYYARLGLILVYFTSWNVLPFDSAAAAQFDELRRLRLRSIGTQDLKIAAITLCHDATLLSSNLQHFRLVPGLRVEDWLYGHA